MTFLMVIEHLSCFLPIAESFNSESIVALVLNIIKLRFAANRLYKPNAFNCVVQRMTHLKELYHAT